MTDLEYAVKHSRNIRIWKPMLSIIQDMILRFFVN